MPSQITGRVGRIGRYGVRVGYPEDLITLNGIDTEYAMVDEAAVVDDSLRRALAERLENRERRFMDASGGEPSGYLSPAEPPIAELRNIAISIYQRFYMPHVPTHPDEILPFLVDIYERGKRDALQRIDNQRNRNEAVVLAYEKEKELKNFIFDIIDEQFQKYVPKEECDDVISKLEKL